MRERFDLRRTLSYLGILAIAVVFALQWGPGRGGLDSPGAGDAPAPAAKVNGREITLGDFNQAYSARLYYARQRISEIAKQLGGQIDVDAMARQQVQPKQVLDQLVDFELREQAAEQHQVVASDQELRELLYRTPDFQREGKFDYGHYTDVLRQYYRKTVPAYEEELRRRLSAEKFEGLLRELAAASEEEVRARYQLQADEVDLGFVRFSPAAFASAVPAPAPAALAAWRAAHDAEVRAEYDLNRPLYQTPPKVHARHLLLRWPANATDAQKAELRARLTTLKAQAKSGDFAALARAHSEDEATQAQGGDLGTQARASSGWPPAVTDAAFRLTPGQVSDPVETGAGLHLVKVDETIAAVDRPLDEVALEIAGQLYRREQATALAKAAAEKALQAAQSGKSLASLYPPAPKADDALPFQAEAKPERQETGPFPASARAVPKLGAARELQADALAAPLGLLPKVYRTGSGFAVAEVTVRRKPSEADFLAKRAQLERDAREAKGAELSQSLLAHLRKVAQLEINPAVLASTAVEVE